LQINSELLLAWLSGLAESSSHFWEGSRQALRVSGRAILAEEGISMQLSAEGLDLIKRFEGFRSRQYTDVAGFPTIGYGHRVVPSESFPGGVSQLQAASLLAADVSAAERAVGSLVKVALTQGQFDALVDFCFNLGAGRLAKSTLLHCLNGGRCDAAAEQLLLWDLAGGEANLGLKARREAELRLWKSAPQLCPVSSSQPPQIGVASSHS
jgi:lysozyme